MLDLKKLAKKIDKAIDEETPESIATWLNKMHKEEKDRKNND